MQVDVKDGRVKELSAEVVRLGDDIAAQRSRCKDTEQLLGVERTRQVSIGFVFYNFDVIFYFDFYFWSFCFHIFASVRYSPAPDFMLHCFACQLFLIFHARARTRGFCSCSRDMLYVAGGAARRDAQRQRATL